MTATPSSLPPLSASSADPLPPDLLRSLAERAGLSLADAHLAALAPAVARAWRQAETLRSLPLQGWEPAPVFAPLPTLEERPPAGAA